MSSHTPNNRHEGPRLRDKAGGGIGTSAGTSAGTSTSADFSIARGTARDWRQSGKKPVRRPRNTGGKNIVGQFASVKMNKLLPFESLIERDFLYLADFEADVQAIEAQPFRIPYTDTNGRLHTYIPDFVLGYADRDLVVECKPAEQVGKAANLVKWEYAREWCAECDFQFVVLTDQVIRQGYRLQNVKLLTQYARHAVLPQVRVAVYNLLSRLPHDAQPLTLGALAEEIAPGEPASAFHSLLTLAYRHKITVPLDAAPLCSETPVWLPDHPPLSTPQPLTFPALYP